MRYPMRGFTLVELVIVIVVLGIMAATVAISFNSSKQHGVTVQADEFRRNLSHIQLLAISQGVRLRLTPTSATRYTLTCLSGCTASTSLAIDSATGNSYVDLSAGTTLSGGTLDLDSLGRPVSGATLVSGISTYTLSGSDNCVDVTVLPITGFASSGAPHACP